MNITVKGLDTLVRKLDGIAQMQSTLEPPMQRAVLRLQRDMADYPPARPGSSYVRTGTLGRRWTTKVDRLANGVRGRVGNNTKYAPFVQSKQFQRPLFKGRWQTDEQVLQRNLPAIEKDFNDAVEKAIKG